MNLSLIAIFFVKWVRFLPDLKEKIPTNNTLKIMKEKKKDCFIIFKMQTFQ